MGVEELREKAPKATAWADGMREIFGDVKLLRVKEGEVELGKPDANVYATCFIVKKPKK